MTEPKELKFVRLKFMPDDLVGYVTYRDDCIVIETPLRVEIDTDFEEGRQILAMQEYLPQSVIELRELEIPMFDILFVTPVRQEFVEQYEYVADFFYNNEHKMKKPEKKRTKALDSTQESVEKVVSILEALQSKKDKPVH